MALEMCSNSSDYVATSLVSSFHGIPHVDINLAASSNTFELSLPYFEAVIVWACVPLLAIICLFFLMSIYFICICCYCCCQEHEEEKSKGSKACCGVLGIVVILLGLACCGVALWAEFAMNSSIVSASSSASHANNVIQQVQSMAQPLNFTEVRHSVQELELAVAASNTSNTGYNTSLEAVRSLSVESESVKSSFGEIRTDASIQDFSSVLTSVDSVEQARHWAVVGYVIATLLVLLLIILSILCSACCNSPVCMTLAMVFLAVYTLTMWLTVGGNLAYLIISGDICYNPDDLIRQQFINASTADLSAGTVDYFLVCNETCRSNPFNISQMSATRSLSTIMDLQNIVSSYITNNTDPGAGTADIQRKLDGVVSTFGHAMSAIGNISVLTNCEQLNADYLGVLSGLCQEGYLYSTVLFAMACIIAISFVIILLCGSFYAGLLSKGKTFDNETVIYDFPSDNGGISPWESYGTQQRYQNNSSQYNYPESMNMIATEPNGPPKYVDLTQETSMGGLNGRNGAQTTGSYDILR